MAANRRGADVRQRSRWLRTTYAPCLLGAGYNRWGAIAQHGLSWDHGGAPRASVLFWTSLAFPDPAAAFLLFARPDAGIAATAAIIVTDVVHNLWFVTRYRPFPLRVIGSSPWMLEQIAFLIFVAATGPLAKRPAPTAAG